MTYTLKLDQAALQLVGVALGKMPHEQVAALIAAIQQQINAQEQAARAAPSGCCVSDRSRELISELMARVSKVKLRAEGAAKLSTSRWEEGEPNSPSGCRNSNANPPLRDNLILCRGLRRTDG